MIGIDQNAASITVLERDRLPATSIGDGGSWAARVRQMAAPMMIQETPDAIANQIAQNARRCQAVQLSG